MFREHPTPALVADIAEVSQKWVTFTVIVYLQQSGWIKKYWENWSHWTLTIDQKCYSHKSTVKIWAHHGKSTHNHYTSSTKFAVNSLFR